MRVLLQTDGPRVIIERSNGTYTLYEYLRNDAQWSFRIIPDKETYEQIKDYYTQVLPVIGEMNHDDSIS